MRINRMPYTSAKAWIIAYNVKSQTIGHNFLMEIIMDKIS